ncbi:MAG: hypothetical protein JJE18_00025 [Eubacteriaceae bacterium]|nr:hypothetical protein [Eubacteriaceae bacterium]
MELKDKLSFGAKRVEYLMEEYFNRDKVLGECKVCPNFAKYWSCPPYTFDEAIFLKQFKYMHIIGRQFEVPREDIRNIRDPKAIAEYCRENFDAIKVMTWKTLLEIENEVDGSMGLIPGNCPICETQGMACARKTNEPCRNPTLMRYSLESLGFNVVDLVKYEVGMTIEWPQNQRLPKVLTSVAAILCNEEIPKDILKKYFPDKRQSWVKYDDTQLDTGFHTSETIKTSETIHGSAAQTMANAKIIDDDMAPYRPQKSWVGYKADKNPEDEAVKKGYTVTMQDEGESQSQTLPEETLETLEEEMHTEVSEEEVAEVFEEIPESQEIVEEKDAINYQWLGFKADLDDDELVKRPIPKMSELIPEGEEIPVIEEEKKIGPELSESPEVPVVEEVLEQLEKMAVAEIIEPETEAIEAITAEITEAIPEEEDDSKYQWLGFKTELEDEDEPLAGKRTKQF